MEIEGNIELLELAFVFLTMIVSLVIVVIFGKLWSA